MGGVSKAGLKGIERIRSVRYEGDMENWKEVGRKVTRQEVCCV